MIARLAGSAVPASHGGHGRTRVAREMDPSLRRIRRSARSTIIGARAAGGRRGGHRPASWYDPWLMSTPFGRDEVLRIAALAHLELTDEEIALFGRQITDILGYVEQVRAVDTTGVAPTSHV